MNVVMYICMYVEIIRIVNVNKYTCTSKTVRLLTLPFRMDGYSCALGKHFSPCSLLIISKKETRNMMKSD